MLVACALVLSTVGVYATTAQAANLVRVSNTLTDSGPGAQSGHFISFEIPADSFIVSTNTIAITFPDDFVDVDQITEPDLTVRVNAGAPIAIGGYSAVGQVVSFTGVTATSTDTVTVQVPAGIVTNPTDIESYEFLITTPRDTGRTRVAIVDYVVVTATVETTFDFVIDGLATSTTVNGTTTTGTASATTIPFGVIDQGQIYTLGQSLSVTTNARNGFVVTVEQDGNLRSANGADIDGFTDGTYVNTPTAWAPPNALIDPGASLLQENMWGHWGLTSNDSTLNAGEFTTGGGDLWVAASTTPRQVFRHTGPADGVTQDYGLALVAYRIQISPLQEAGDDYQTTLMYIATPTF
jgi:hypothetical protein